MKLNYSARVKIALAIIVFSALLSSAVSLGLELKKLLNANSADKVTLAERRFACLKPVLSGYKVVGYFTDLEGDTEYAKMQYVLAPVIAVREKTHSILIGNFHSPVSESAVSDMNLALLKKFDNGITVFKNRALK